MVQEWERSVSGLLEEELNVGKFATTKWLYAEIYDFAVSNQEENQKKKSQIKKHNYGWYPSSFSKCRNRDTLQVVD